MFLNYRLPWVAGEEDCDDGSDEYLDICSTTPSPVTASPTLTPTVDPSAAPSGSPSGAPGTSAPTTQAPTSAAPTEGCGDSELECQDGDCIPASLACDGELAWSVGDAADQFCTHSEVVNCGCDL